MLSAVARLRAFTLGIDAHRPTLPLCSGLHVTTNDYSFIESLSDAELRRRLLQRDVNEYVVENLISERDTQGAKWRIQQEIGEG
jgi:hypothetical protein